MIVSNLNLIERRKCRHAEPTKKLPSFESQKTKSIRQSRKRPKRKIGKMRFTLNHVDSCATTYDDEITRNSAKRAPKINPLKMNSSNARERITNCLRHVIRNKFIDCWRLHEQIMKMCHRRRTLYVEWKKKKKRRNIAPVRFSSVFSCGWQIDEQHQQTAKKKISVQI